MMSGYYAKCAYMDKGCDAFIADVKLQTQFYVRDIVTFYKIVVESKIISGILRCSSLIL